MNITVRVASAQALAQLRAIQTQAAATGNAGNVAGGALANMVGSRSMSNMTKFGNQLQWTGRQLQYNFTLPILLAGAAATKFALENQAAFVKVVKVYGDVGMSQKQITSETNALRGAFVALSNHFGVQQKAVLDVAASWAAAGASGLALAKDVKLTMETMILGEMGAADATNALIAIQAQYNQNTDQLTKTIQILNMVENQTGISLEGLVQGMSRAAGTAAGAGIDVRHLAAMLAAMTPAAGSAAQAGNALKTIISRLFAPTKDASAVMKQMGIETSSTAWQSKNGSQRMEMLADSFVKLNKAQQSAASSIIASRFQINKFGVLMKDIANRNTDAGKSISYYARSLESTQNPQAVFNQMQRELNQVLTSNPQRLKQIWTILQNAMADVVTPMIPALLMLAQMLQKAVTWFSQLNPSVQKFIGVGVLMLALFGPLIRYAGSLITLVMELGNTFKILLLPLMSLGGLLGSVGGMLGGAFTGALVALRVVLLGAGAAIGLFGGAFMRLLSPVASVIGTIAGPLMRGFATIVSGTFVWLGATLASTWSAAWGVLGSLTSAGVGLVTSIFTVLPNALRASASVLWTGLVVIWEAGTAAIGGISSLFVRSTFFIMSTLFTGLPAMFSRGFAVLVGTARFGLYGLVGLIAGLPGLILRSGPALIGALGSMGRLAIVAFTSPWGAAIAIVVGAIVLFRNQIGQIIQNIIGLFYQLPGGLIGALRGVVQVVQAAAMQVYEWMQYLNPFAHHSPSVVDNVTAGMAAINAQVATLAATAGPLQKAGADMQRYGKIVASMKDAQAGRQRTDDRASIGKVNPQALGAFDTLNRDLASLNGLLATSQAAINAQQRVVDAWSAALDRANAALDAQKAKLDQLQKVQSAANDQLTAAKDRLSQWASTPIQGMKAMGDAIFNNSIQQKRLQLQMMKMEDSIGPIDKVRSRIDKLNGEMELMQGTASDLRAKGAGSDILKVYNQQIGALNQQKKAITQQLKPYDDLQAALDRLQRTGQELDLQNSLKFDPLTRQIEQAANAMKEMPFGVIMKGVQQARADIIRYQAAVDQATAAVNAQQKAVDAAQKARDAISARYDVENKKLDQLKKSYQGVQDAIDGVKGALGDMSGAANDAIQRQQKALDDAAAKRKAHEAALKKAKAAKEKKGPKVPGLSPQMQAFMDAGKAGDFPGVTGTGGLGRQGPAGDQSKMIDDFTKDLAKQTAGMFDNFDIFGPIKDKWNQFVAWLQPKIGAVKNFLGQIFKGVDWSQPFRGLNFDWLGKLRDMVVSFGSTIIEWVGKIWQLIGPDILNIGKQLWAGLQSIWQQVQPQLAQFGELWTPALHALSNIWAVISPVLQAIGLGFLAAASILLHVLGSIIGPVFEAIGGILAGFLSIVRGVLRIVIGLFTGDWSMLWKGVVDIFGGAWKIIVALFVGVGKTLWGIVSGYRDWHVSNFFKWLVRCRCRPLVLFLT
jgi:TP901 family phage tail tape measure protein